MVGEVPAVLLECTEVVLREPAREPALDRGSLVAREVDAARLAQLLEHAHQPGRIRRCLRELGELRADRGRWQHHVGDVRGDRAARHLIELRRRGVLDEGEPARGADRAEPFGAIVRGSG
jgi:hypothetical protein